MKYLIIYDKPGRIRVRMGQYAFTREQGYGIENLLSREKGICSVETSSSNGGILIHYQGECRQTILTILDGLRRTELQAGKKSEEAKTRELNQGFYGKVARMVIAHYAVRLLIPSPLRLVRAVFHASKFVRKGLRALAAGKVNVEVLDAASILCAFAQRSPKTASSIMLLLQISECLEENTRKKTRNALAESLAVHVDQVWQVTEKGDVKVPLSAVRPGDRIRVQAGSLIPADGAVRSGDAMVNESSMTGEPMAVLRRRGHTVYAGTAVEEGNIEIEVTKLAGESRIQSIVRMIDQSEILKAGVQGKAECLADSIVPFSFATSLATLLLTRNLTKAMSVLMVDYSCALKLSVPIAVISAMREAAGRRILVKGGKFLEGFAQADTIIFDKTGTLTSAAPRVAKVIAFGGYTKEEVLRDAACLEEHFPHSVARAVVEKAAEQSLNHQEEHARVEYVVAHGISTILRERRAQIGSAHFIFEDERISYTEEVRRAEDVEMQGLSVIYLAVGGAVAGMIGIEDPVRKDAAAVIEILRKKGFKHIIMMTGDSEAAAARAARELHIVEYQAQVLPEDKAGMVKKLKEQGCKVIMVGDGINDSPALAAADVSVAMRDSSDLAKEVADITLLSEKLTDLLVLRELSEKLMGRIYRNYGFILSFNTLLMSLGIAGALSPSVTSLLHNLSTMVISGNSTRLYLEDKGKES
ncbi:heavy metal translocating P-type ATPase [Lachnospiraceae bacterium OF09-33XD]|nr:heavy metal translocating P-type ATPase [Lachnospiraceae bacterium OF09-33XD]